MSGADLRLASCRGIWTRRWVGVNLSAQQSRKWQSGSRPTSGFMDVSALAFHRRGNISINRLYANALFVARIRRGKSVIFGHARVPESCPKDFAANPPEMGIHFYCIQSGGLIQATPAYPRDFWQHIPALQPGGEVAGVL
jgi:hypothetical protein